MRSPQLTFCAAVAACAVTAAPAHAGEKPGAGTGTVSVTPVSAVPGGDVILRVTGCPAAEATALSGAFAGTVPLARVAGDLTGHARIGSDAQPGTHPVTVACPGADGRTTKVTGTMQVSTPVAPSAAGRGGARPATRETPPGQADPDGKAPPAGELSSTSAVGLVLAGGVLLVIAGQLLRLRLRLRRERQGGTDES
ncbi:hypothetical protein [Streptomyces sp. NPDC048248]|uniref:hypothetical protein n=1 Tax=Streptomyces sp. NPDC048248 TaxID=3365523 RepID=UPI00371E6A0D